MSWLFWKRKKKEYIPLAPPFQKPNHELTKAEAKYYFYWYVSKLDERTVYLREITGLTLDYSAESLIGLWKWFIKNATIENTPQKEMEELRQQLIATNNPFAESILEKSKRRFSLLTEYMLRDIGMYMGETYVKNYPLITWTYYTKPKNDVFVNCPVLMMPNEIYPEKKGIPFEPIHMAGVQACKLMRSEASAKDLYNIYRQEEDKIINHMQWQKEQEGKN